jgi:hypothetical protein
LFEVKEIISFNYVRKSFIDDVTYKLIGDGGEDDWEEVGCFVAGGSSCGGFLSPRPILTLCAHFGECLLVWNY